MNTHRSRKRICLFAGYNKLGRVAPYVMDYLTELARHSTVFYLADGQLDEVELRRLKTVCEGAWAIDHGKYDFGSYSELACRLVGWDRLLQSDEVILANDSCFCLQPFDAVFAKMDQDESDAWGLLATDEDNKDRLFTLDEYLAIPSKKIPLFCLGSYFVAFRTRVLNDRSFQNFLSSVDRQPDRLTVCLRYEMGLVVLLKNSGFRLSAYIGIVHRNATIYDEQAFRLLKKGFPLVKVKIFTVNPLGLRNLEDWPAVVSRLVGNDRIFGYLDQIGFEWPDRREPPAREPPKALFDHWLPPLVRHGPRAAAKQLLPPALLTSYRRVRDATLRLPPREPERASISSAAEETLRRVTSSKSVVIFFNLAYDTIGGGMLSINRFVGASLQLGPELGFDVLVSGLPLGEHVVEYSMFEAVAPMIHFSDIVARIRPDDVTMHIPEYCIPVFLGQLTDTELRWMKTRPHLRLNILDQNHELLPNRSFIERLRDISDDVTLSAAHVRCVTQQTADEVDCPVSLLTPFLPKLRRVPFEEKEKVIALSPDPGPNHKGCTTKQDVLNLLKELLPDYRVVTIEKMTLDAYEQLISQARFSITFGEGYDGYFVEPFLCGSVSFAVYNNTFFPVEFRNAPTVYSSWTDLSERIAPDIRSLESEPGRYRSVQATTEEMIRKYSNDDLSAANLREFYDRQFAFLPQVFQHDPLFARGNDAGERGRTFREDEFPQ